MSEKEEFQINDYLNTVNSFYYSEMIDNINNLDAAITTQMNDEALKKKLVEKFKDLKLSDEEVVRLSHNNLLVNKILEESDIYDLFKRVLDLVRKQYSLFTSQKVVEPSKESVMAIFKGIMDTFTKAMYQMPLYPITDNDSEWVELNSLDPNVKATLNKKFEEFKLKVKSVNKKAYMIVKTEDGKYYDLYNVTVDNLNEKEIKSFPYSVG